MRYTDAVRQLATINCLLRDYGISGIQAEIARLLVIGYTQAEVGDILGLNQSSVCRHVNIIRQIIDDRCICT
jgi:DNA-binding CsgD family transcriptional regulator